jgi:hypothetical protein
LHGEKFLHADFGTTKLMRVLKLGGNNGVYVSSYLELLKTKEVNCYACKRTRLSGLKSELLCASYTGAGSMLLFYILVVMLSPNIVSLTLNYGILY